jgi:hypothetical protein
MVAERGWAIPADLEKLSDRTMSDAQANGSSADTGGDITGLAHVNIQVRWTFRMG